MLSMEVKVLGATEHRLGQECTAPASDVIAQETTPSALRQHAPMWHWSTKEIAPRERVSQWHEVHALAIARRTISVEVEEFGDVDVHLCRLGSQRQPVSIQRMHIGAPSVATREASLLHDGSDDVILHLQLSGQRRLQQCRREAECPTGAAVFSWNAEPSRIVLPQASSFFSIALPHRRLRALAPGIEDAMARTVPSHHPVLGLLRNYLSLIDMNATSIDAGLAQLMGGHILDLAAQLADNARASLAGEACGGLRAARLHAIRTDIATHLDEQVSASAVAARLGMSTRYVHKLFESEGLSVSGYVMGLRLEKVWRQLGDPSQRRRTIADIVYATGFGDISTFNRAFRARYGMTPGDARRLGEQEALACREAGRDPPLVSGHPAQKG